MALYECSGFEPSHEGTGTGSWSSKARGACEVPAESLAPAVLESASRLRMGLEAADAGTEGFECPARMRAAAS